MSDREVALKFKIIKPEKRGWRDGSRLKESVTLPEEQIWFPASRWCGLQSPITQNLGI